MRTPLIAGNWKMNLSLTEARALVRGIVEGMDSGDRAESLRAEILVCPSHHLLFPIAKAVADTRIMMGAQDAHEAPHGAFTGAVSVPMVAETGCTHVIIGHSERRHVFGETGETLAKKVRAVVGGGLTVIYCVGETLEQRERGRMEQVVGQQLSEVLDGDVPADRLVVAYEPVWAIGTGKTATPAQAQEVHAFVRGRLADCYDAEIARTVRILYGGSVKPDNARDLLEQPDIDGALVGGASLVAGDFLAIMAAATTIAAASG